MGFSISGLDTFENPDNTSNSLAISSGRGAEDKFSNIQRYALNYPIILNLYGINHCLPFSNFEIYITNDIIPAIAVGSVFLLQESFEFCLSLITKLQEAKSSRRFNDPPRLLSRLRYIKLTFR